MARSIAFIADSDRAFIDYQRDLKLEEWSQVGNYSEVTSVNSAGQTGLFGSPPVSIIELSDKEQVPAILEAFEAADQTAIERWSTPGLIIISTVNRNSTKKLEKFVESSGGAVVLSKDVSENGSVAAGLLKELKLTSEVKNFLTAYAGEDKAMLISLVRTMSKIPEASQKKVTVDDVILRIPTPPGAIPPWDIEKHLLAGDLTKTLEVYRRTVGGTHLLVVLKVLNNKFTLAWKATALLSLEPRLTQSEIAKKLGVNDNYPLKLAIGTGKKYGLPRVQKVLELIAEADVALKGGANTDSVVTMEVLLISIHNALKG